MSKPRIAGTEPIEVPLSAGESYYWCACGKSQNQPFCDGSHRGTQFVPLEFEVDSSTSAHLCMCKQTKNPPYCDGSHVGLEMPAAESPGDALEAQPTPEEPTVKYIHDLAKHGLSKVGQHGPMGAMGVPRSNLPHWDDIQILAAQFATKPKRDDAPIATKLVIGLTQKNR